MDKLAGKTIRMSTIVVVPPQSVDLTQLDPNGPAYKTFTSPTLGVEIGPPRELFPQDVRIMITKRDPGRRRSSRTVHVGGTLDLAVGAGDWRPNPRTQSQATPEETHR
jgi:hypothetical protein